MQEETLKIRKMEQGDPGRICRLECSPFLTSWSLEAFEKALRDPMGLNRVAEDRSGLIGYLTAFRVLDEACLTNLFVVQRRRRRGVGKMLLNNLIERASIEGVKQLFLEVRKGNEPAIRLYEKMNFSTVSVRKGYYSDTSEDALVMRMPLAEH
ncbi:MAG: ribosomal protein S18-alanine N-acetyltransferase [Deltaproteobacteria bacterium]|nr:ribosomal protein S18-alanine N-acetyltransferase [Deltaproteobacteria bacterium]